MFGIFDADEDAVTIDVGKRRWWLRDLAARQLVFLQVMLVGLDMSQLLKQKLMGLTRVDHQSGRDASGHLNEPPSMLCLMSAQSAPGVFRRSDSGVRRCSPANMPTNSNPCLTPVQKRLAATIWPESSHHARSTVCNPAECFSQRRKLLPTLTQPPYECNLLTTQLLAMPSLQVELM